MAMKTFEMIQEDIDAAEGRHSGSMCPIARCLHRNGYPFAIVGSWGIFLKGYIYSPRIHSGWSPPTLLSKSTPISEQLRNWIARYDSKMPVGPITFSLEIDEADDAAPS